MTSEVEKKHGGEQRLEVGACNFIEQGQERFTQSVTSEQGPSVNEGRDNVDIWQKE